MAPELLTDENDLSKADTFALGVILINMLFGPSTFAVPPQTNSELCDLLNTMIC